MDSNVTYTMRAHAAITNFLTRKLQGHQPVPVVEIPKVVFSEIPEGSTSNLVTADTVEHNLQEQQSANVNAIMDQFNVYKTMYLRTVQAAINEPATIPAALESKIDALTSKLNEIEIENTTSIEYGKTCASQRSSLLQCFERNPNDALKCSEVAFDFNKCVRAL